MVEAALGREATRDSHLCREIKQTIIQLQPPPGTRVHEVLSGNTGGQDFATGTVFWHWELTPGTPQLKGNK